MKILHVVGQWLEKTGSGIYIRDIMRKSREHGFSSHLVAGVPSGSVPDLVETPPETWARRRPFTAA